MKPFFARLVYGWTIILLACIAMIGILLFSVGDTILVAKWRPIIGLLGFIILSISVIASIDSKIIGGGLAAGIGLMAISMFFEWRHPMHPYACVRHVTSDDYIEADNIWLRDSPIVKMLEIEGTRKSPEGGSFWVERYLYSARTALMMKRRLGDGPASPSLSYETHGFPAWIFGIRAACEQFTFFAVNLTPIIAGLAWYFGRSGRPQLSSSRVTATHAIFLLAPFCVGLAPIIKRGSKVQRIADQK